MGRTKHLNDERKARREVPLPDVKLTTAPVEESLAVTQPHVAPTAVPKAKTKRTQSSASLKRKAKELMKGEARTEQLDKRRGKVVTKKELKKRAKQLWE